jgi:hypothetical protein
MINPAESLTWHKNGKNPDTPTFVIGVGLGGVCCGWEYKR